MPNEQLISDFEALIRRDPARRGLIGSDGKGPGRGELIRAADLLAPGKNVTGIGLITGFFVPETSSSGGSTCSSELALQNQRGHAETDGPPGTAVLADVLAQSGLPVTVFTDELCKPVVQAACEFVTGTSLPILASPNDSEEAAAWRAGVLEDSRIQEISHFIAIERAGPGYLLEASDPERITGKRESVRGTSGWQPGHCCNMRGESIDAFSADLHLLIESTVALNPRVKVVGIGDGGNEIGMGRFSRDELITRIPGPHADRIPCRISADATIVAGVSNWGACALAAAIAVQQDRVDLLARHTAESQFHLLERIVSQAGAVDGVTRRNEPTVDGLPLLTQIQPWISIRERLGLRP